MGKLECPDCGSPLSEKDPICPFCGGPNPFYQNSAKAKPVVRESAPAPQHQPTPQYQQQPVVKNSTPFNVGIFILLLIFFWPAALIYLVVKAIK